MRYQGLGRKENPTERAIVEVIHSDGTYDCRVPGRSHPYTRLQSCEGQTPLHVGQTVEVAFVDYQRTGRRWMPFILGASKSHLGSGTSRGRVSRGLAWHNGVEGKPDYTGSLYSLDTGYRKWRLDTGWSIPGSWDAIIGYTIDQGYILTVKGKDVRCYLAENGALAWEHELPEDGGRPIYNPKRQEVVFFYNYNRIDAIIEATTGSLLAGSHVLPTKAGRSVYRAFIWGDRLYEGRYYQWNDYPRDPYSHIWVRSGSAGYVPVGDVAWEIPKPPWMQPHQSRPGVFYPFNHICNGKAAFVIHQHTTHLYKTDNRRAWVCLSLLDFATGINAITDVTYGPPPIGEGYYSLTVNQHVTAMSRDGYMYGMFLYDKSDGSQFNHISYYASWKPDGTRLHTGPVESGWDPILRKPLILSPCTSSLAVVRDLDTDTWSVIQNLAPLWSLPSGDFFSGHGGESTRGEDSWALVASLNGLHFRDFRTGALLGPWAGSTPVMVSAGIIYDTDDDGNLRRWVG